MNKTERLDWLKTLIKVYTYEKDWKQFPLVSKVDREKGVITYMTAIEIAKEYDITEEDIEKYALLWDGKC